MSYAETSTYRRAAGNIQFRGNVVYGFRVVSIIGFILFQKCIKSSFITSSCLFILWKFHFLFLRL